MKSAQAVDVGGTVPGWVDRDGYPFRSRWLRLPSGQRMHYVDEGEGEVLLFVHGTPTWSYEWRHVIRALAGTHRCIAPDHLGFGLSDRPRDGSYTPEWHAANLSAFVDGLGLESFTLVVHDYGGPIGVPLALDRPGVVRRLVVLNSFLWSLRGQPDVERGAKLLGGRFGRFLYRWLNVSLRVIVPMAFADRKKLSGGVHGQYLAPFRDRWARGAVLWPLAHALLGSSEFYDSLWRRRGVLAELPSLIVWGVRDPAFRPELAARWKQALPHARIVELATGHWPHEEAPDDVVRELRRFLGG